MALAYQQLMIDNPDYVSTVKALPKKMCSGKSATSFAGYFFCYELPVKKADGSWSDGDGWYRWYLLDPNTGNVIDQSYQIWQAIKCGTDEPRKMHTSEDSFAQARKQIDKYIKKNYMRAIQAPLGVKPRLVTWLELC